MGRSIFNGGFIHSLIEFAAYPVAAMLVCLAVYLVAREMIALAWLSRSISDAALGALQVTLLLFISFMPIVFLCAYLVLCAFNAYFAYYYPWSIFMT